MAKTIHTGYFLAAGGSTATLHSAAGRLLAFLIAHTQTSIQTVTFYDNTAASGTKILVVDVSRNETPAYIVFERDAGIAFSTGLHVDQGNCNVAVWSVDHG
jgi:hypothetical protein